MTLLASAALPAIAHAQTAATPQTDTAAAPAPAPVENAPAPDSPDIVVTAQKRATNLQSTPLAISAVEGTQLRNRQVNDLEALAPSIPNVNFGKNIGIARIAIRGLGLDTTVAGQEGRVAYHLDGVYVASPAAALSTFYDVDRVEVVRGPQGTLYGRNATAGAVNVITSDPSSTFGGYGKLTIGNYGSFTEEGALTGPASDTTSARIAFIKTDRGGYGKNLTTGQDIDDEHSFGIRAKIKFQPSSDFRLTLEADYYTRNDAAFGYHYVGQGNPNLVPYAQQLGGRIPPNPRNTFANVQAEDQRNFGGVAATAVVNLGFAELTSISAYRDGRYRILTDADDTQVQITQFLATERRRQFSQELRLAGTVGPLRWIVGGYYFNDKTFGEVRFSPARTGTSNLISFGRNSDGTLKADAYAGFGQLDYDILPGLTLTAGVRYSHETKSINQRGAVEFARPYDPAQQPNYTLFQNASVSFADTTPKFGIEYRPTSNIMLYATYAQGFKSGGYNLVSFDPPLKSENLTDYEAGIKTQFLNKAVTFNLAGFYYDYSNLQVQIVRAVISLENAASARLKGLEGELIVRPIRGLELSGNGAYLKSEFLDYITADAARPLGPGPSSPQYVPGSTSFNLRGNQLPQAPTWTANGAAQYAFDVGRDRLTLRGEVTYTSRIFFSPFNRDAVSQAGYVKENAVVTYSLPNGVNISGFIRNIGDRRTISSAQVSGGFSGSPIMGAYDPPRTYGGSISYTF